MKDATRLTFAVVLLNAQFRFNISIDKLVHIDHVIGTFGTGGRARR